ncbi:unnamed protein product [Ectocarpus sp. CCAP 1310/34]|nr:unnamed protein product [Ectocarpus sp. CCAP 1310/34]
MTSDDASEEVVSVEVLWVGMVILAVLLMLPARWGAGSSIRKASRAPGSSSSRRTGSTGTSTSTHGCSTAAALEKRAEELEAAGDLDGAMEALLASHDQGSSRAVTLAHELSQRHPVGALGGNRCPLSIRSPRRKVGGGVEAGASPDPEASSAAVADADAAAPAAVSVVAPVCAAALTSLASEVLADDNNDGVTSVPEEHCKRSLPSGEERRHVTLSGESASATAAGPASQSAATTATGALEPGKRIDHGGGEPTTTTLLPWERGWQGREGFKPPPSSSALADTGSSASRDAAGTAAAFGAGLSPSSSSFAETGVQSDDALDVGDAEATKLARRNFTVRQLNAFDGGCSAPRMRGGEARAGKQRPIYIALKGEVYDASAGRHLYGPGGEYSEFAGHDISRRVAHGASHSDRSSNTLLDDLSLENLGRFEQMTLRGWEDTFRARGYPSLGRVVAPPPPRLFSRAELRAFDGRSAHVAGPEYEETERRAGAGREEREVGGGEPGEQVAALGRHEEQPAESLPPEQEAKATANAVCFSNYAARPIYMGVKDKVFDVSFGGSEFYLEGGPYECLAGRDASRVLAKMSMASEDIEGVLDYSCLTDREEKNLADWVAKLGEGGKGYPVVGWIDLGSYRSGR